MHNYQHGRWIPNPLGPEKPEILVKSEDEHKAKNPADYEKSLLEAPTTGRTVQEAVNDERQRCAAVARTFQRAFGTEIADAIMGKAPESSKQKPPTIAEIMNAGYKAAAAEKVYAEEQEKAAKGYPPYGNNEPPAPDAPPATIPAVPGDHAWRPEDDATAPAGAKV